MVEPIYHFPREYDLEHAKHELDVDFYVQLAKRWRPGKILELGCGTGRVSIPLALETAGIADEIAGLDCVPEMLNAAREKSAGLDAVKSGRLRWIEGDLRTWHDDHGYDLIIAPCGTLSHLLSVDEQLVAWRRAFANLTPGGRFIADVPMAELTILAESLQTPPRAILQIDNETARTSRSGEEKRLIRYKSVTYSAADQRASVRYLYDEFQDDVRPKRFLSDYDQHVYYPREMELLFRAAGFRLEFIWGNHRGEPLSNSSRTLIMVGARA